MTFPQAPRALRYFLLPRATPRRGRMAERTERFDDDADAVKPRLSSASDMPGFVTEAGAAAGVLEKEKAGDKLKLQVACARNIATGPPKPSSSPPSPSRNSKNPEASSCPRAVSSQALPVHGPPSRRPRRSRPSAAMIFADAGVSADRGGDRILGHHQGDRRAILTPASAVRVRPTGSLFRDVRDRHVSIQS